MVNVPDEKTAAILQSKDFQDLLTFYCQKLKDFCKFFKFPRQVEFTSVVIFKRFYESTVRNPKTVLISTLFLAGKVENLKVDLNEFLSKIPKPPTRNQVLDTEMLIAKTIGFEFMVKSPYFPLHGFYLDMQRESGISIVNSVYMKAVAIMEKVVLTDLVLSKTPTQLALACIYYITNHSRAGEGFDLMEYLKNRIDESDERMGRLEELLISMCKDIDAVKVIDKERAKNLSLKYDEFFENQEKV